MTYGWAILIIALTLAVLYSLGIMNPKNFLPRAPPGSCFVFRPNGPGTTDFISLQGTCGYLPMYVASFNGSANIVINSLSPLLPGNQATMAVWAYWTSGPHVVGSCCGSRQEILGSDSAPGYEVNPIIAVNDSGTNEAETWVCTTTACWPEAKSPPNSIITGRWYFLVSRYNGSYLSLWINGIQVATTGVSGNLALQGSGLYTYIGSRSTTGSFFNGKVANAQIYNTALTQQEIQYLYQEGLGGGPIRLQNLVGWWPLNGDAKDYSGNNNNGKIYYVTFIQNYNPP